MPKDEEIFFKVFERIVGKDHLKAKALGRKVFPTDVFLNTDHTQYTFPDEVSYEIDSILKELFSTDPVSSRSLSHYIDGFLTNHPALGTRIVEFDEEQHFNTFREITLNHLLSITSAKYIPHFLECCTNVNYFNRMLKKHRLKIQVNSIPRDALSFKELVERDANSNSKYIKLTHAFYYHGGRIAQRAYYDTLRDVAHLAKENSSLEPPLRFSKFEFKEKTGLNFKDIGESKLHTLIEERLSELI